MAHTIRAAQVTDVPVILGFIRGLATYEKLLHEVKATEEKLQASLFPPAGAPAAEALLAFEKEQPVGFALYFTTYSTFLAQPGLHLEDLFVIPEARGRGIGRGLLSQLARLCTERGYGRMEWTVLDWNQPAIAFYQALGAQILPDWKICRLTGTALDRFA